MKALVVALAMMTTAWAADIRTEVLSKGEYQGKGSGSFEMSRESALSIITDYENTCQLSSCRYQMPSVEETRIIGDRNSDIFHTWTRVKNIKKGSYFSEILVKRAEDHIEVISRSLDGSEAAELARSTELEHKPIMDSTTVRWLIREGHADVTITVTSDDFFVNRFPSKVLANLKESIESLFGNFAQ